MTFQTPLQTDDYTKLRTANGNNDWWARQFITLCKNEIVFSGQIAAASNASSIEAFTYDTTFIGAYTDVEIGETIFISHTNDIRAAYWRGRIRKDPTANIVYINETSVNLATDDYFWVVYDFDVWDVLSRMFGATQYWDWDIAFHPLQPAIVGLQTAYIQYDPAGSTYRIAFDVSNSFATDANSTSSLDFQFTFVAGTYTVVSGSLATAIVTVDFDADTENWGKLEVTDSQGTVKTRRFYIRNHGASDPPSLNFSGCQITGSLDSGWNATVSAWDGVDDVLDQTFTVVSNQEYYNGVLGPVSIANNIDMVGRFHRETNEGRGDPTYSYVASVRFEIEGICTQMQRLEEQDLTTIYKTTATAIDEISYNTPQRSILYYLDEHSTVTRLCDVTFPDGFDTTYLFQYVPNQGGNVLDAIRGIAAQFNGNVEFAPDGRIQIVRDTRFLTDKSGVPVIANWTTADFTTISVPVDPVNKTGRVDAYGATFNADNTNAFRSRAPGSAQGYAAGQSTLDNQILEATSDANAARSELNYRSGQQMAIDNLTVTQDWKATTGGYHFLIPSRGQRVTHTLPTSTNVRGRAWTTSDCWQIVSITISHDNATGAREVSTTEELEPPVGDSGDNVPQIAGGTQYNPITLSPLDPFASLPDDPSNYLSDDPTPNPYPPLVPPTTGETVIYTDGSLIDTSRSVTTRRNPVWTGITPTSLGSFVPKDITFDRTTVVAPIGAYVICTDGTDSKSFYTTDAFASPVVWTEGDTFSGVYTQVRSYGTPGSVAFYATGDIGVDTNANNGELLGVIGDFRDGISPADNGVYQEAQTFKVPTSGVLTQLTFYLIGSHGTPAGTITWDVQTTTAGVPDGGSLKTGTISPIANATNTINVTSGPSLTSGTLYALVLSSTSAQASNVYWQWSYSSSNPYPDGTRCYKIDAGAWTAQGSVDFQMTAAVAGSSSDVRYSDDYGATVTSPISVGSGAGSVAGFDVERVGGVTLAAANGQVKISTTLGGSFSNATGGALAAGQPVVITLPIRRFPHGATQYSASDPDYIVGSNVANAGASLYKVNGVSGVQTNITPVSGATCIGPNTVTVWQTSAICYILAIVNDAGTFKVYRSLDAGGTWSLSKTCTNPIYLRYKRNSPAVLYLLDGTSLFVSLNHGASWLQDTLPTSNVAVAMDMYS